MKIKTTITENNRITKVILEDGTEIIVDLIIPVRTEKMSDILTIEQYIIWAQDKEIWYYTIKIWRKKNDADRK